MSTFTAPLRTGVAAALTLIAGTTAAQAQEAGDWVIRGRAIAIVPEESSTVSIGGEVDVSTSYVPEFDFTYFATDNIAFELIAAIAEHDLTAVGTAVGDVDLGDKWVLPPTLLAQYHFRVSDTVKPYVGVGVNYTFFFADDEGDVEDIALSDEFGFALQAGFDVDLGDNWLLNVDVKRLFLSTDATINGGAITADVDLDPWVFGVGFGYRF